MELICLEITGIGSTIMGVALMIGMLVTPYAEDAFAQLDLDSLHCRKFVDSLWVANE